MERLLTGIQSTGIPHLGNLLGAIKPAINLANKQKDNSFFFIANLHSITQIKNKEQLKQNTLQTAAVWLACGLDVNKSIFYRQSDVPEVCELAWYLSCFFPFQRLSLAHSFKDKSDRLQDVNVGLFSYPMLMAADILLYDAKHVPVGKDQLQHIEFARDVAGRFNHQMGKTFTLPEAITDTNSKWVPGTDCEKMSKSKGNTINLFCSDKQLRKQIMKIKTDSLSVEESKNPEKDTVFILYSLLAKEDEIESMKSNYLNGGYGYGDAKQTLFEKLSYSFAGIREKYDRLIQNPDKIEYQLQNGAKKAREIAQSKLMDVKEKLGL